MFNDLLAMGTGGGSGSSLAHTNMTVTTTSRNTVTSIKSDNLAVMYVVTNTSSASYQAYAMCFFENGQVINDDSSFVREYDYIS